MRKDREKAYELRRKGKSYKEIRAKLSIPLATLSGWFKDEAWSQEIRDRLGIKVSLAYPEKQKLMVAANKKRWADLRKGYEQEAIDEFPNLKDNHLFISGIMLYWGEGDKSKFSNLKLANSDPTMVRVFYLFLTSALDIPREKIKIALLLYPDLVDTVQKNFWSRLIGIPLSQFTKSTYIIGRHPTRRLSYGVCNIIVSSRQVKDKVIKWIELYRNHLETYTPASIEKL